MNIDRLDTEVGRHLHRLLDAHPAPATMEDLVMASLESERSRDPARHPLRLHPPHPSRRMVGVAVSLATAVMVAGIVSASFAINHHVVGGGNRNQGPLETRPSPTYSWTPYPGKPSSVPYVPPATAQVVSTVTASPPLVVTYDNSQRLTTTSAVRYIARNYAGKTVGTISIDQAAQAAGVLVSPDGSKLLIGDLVFDIHGHELANLYSTTYADALVQPVWADDSDHLCGVASGNSTGELRGVLLEFSASGGVRTVAQLGPSSATSGGWSVLACSPASDRVVIAQEEGAQSEVLVLRLSTGQVLASYPGPAPGFGVVANHDGSLLAIDGAQGITIRNTNTGRRMATLVRRADVNGSSVIAESLLFSWDGSRLLIESDIAQGGPRWIVAWSTNTNLATTQSMSLADVVPLLGGATMFIQDPSAPYTAYFLQANGTLIKVG